MHEDHNHDEPEISDEEFCRSVAFFFEGVPE